MIPLPPDPVSPHAAADPVAAVLAAIRDDRLMALPTSGTAGTPRAVVRTARSWADSFPVVGELTGLDASARVWVPGPLSATMNLFAAAHAAWAGARLVHGPAEATHLQLTPTGLRGLLDALDDDADLTGRTIVVAGDALDRSLRRRAEQGGAAVAHYYGAAELSFVAWGSDRDALTAFPGAEVAVRGGEIWVRSPYVAVGYRDGATGPLRHDEAGFATVGDRGRLDGDRLVVDGRPETVLTAGATVSVTEVEAAIRPGLAGQVAVVGVPHERLGQVVVAVLTEPDDERRAREAAAGLGAGRPRRWLIRELPTTPAGKVDRGALTAAVTAELSGRSSRPAR